MEKVLSLPVHFFNVTSEKDDRLLKIKIYGVSEGITRNDSGFTLESLETAIPTVPHTAILAKYDDFKKDVLGHELELKYDPETGEEYFDFQKGERIIGIVPLDSEIKIEELNGKKWLTYTAYVLTNYNYQIKKMLQKAKSKKISVEIRVLESDIDEKTGFETIKKFILLGTTLLGDKLTTGVVDAKLEVVDGLMFSQKNVACFAEMVKHAIDGDEHIAEDEKVVEDDIPAIVANMSSDEKPALKMSLTKKSASNSPWSSVDKTKLRNDLLDRPNTSNLVEKCYLVVDEGWEEKPSEALKYPVCQIKNDTLVYNINGVQAANSRLEQNTNESYYKSAHAKLMRIYRILGLKAEQNHINYQGGSTHMKEKFIALFSEGGKYKYLNSTEKSVTAFSIEDKKFVMIPFSVEEDAIVMQEDKLMEAEIFAKPLEDNEEFEAMGCHEYVSELYEEVEKMSAEVKEKDEKVVEMEASKTVEMEAKEAEFAEKIEKLEADKTFALEEVKKYKEIQFSTSLSQLAKEYKMNEEDVKSWSEKFSTFAVVEDFEKEVVFEQHKKNLSFSKDSTHINLGGVDKTKTAEKKRAVDRIKETLIK